MKKLHPGARWDFRIAGYIWAAILSVAVLWFVRSDTVSFFSSIFGSNLPVNLIYLLVIIFVGEVYARMAYNRWFYELKEDSLRLERGIIWKKYSNVPYERIQNVDIYRGIIARIFGFSMVMIQTAGFSGQANAEGTIPAVGVKEAEKIREFVMKKVKGARGSGV